MPEMLPLTTKEVSDLLANSFPVSRQTVVRWVEHQGLPCVRIGPRGHRRIHPADLAAFLRKNSHPVPPSLENS